MAEPRETAPTARTRRLPPSERRTRVLDAFIDLVLERGAHPRPDQVAERAGVSIASLYRYFTDLDELRHDALARLAERYPDLFAIRGVATGDRAQRIDAVTSARLALHEALHPLELLAGATSLRDPAAARHLHTVRRAMADQLRLHFGAELNTLSPTRREDVVATIAALTSVESWQQFRRTHERTTAQTRRAWNDALDRILPATPAASRGD